MSCILSLTCIVPYNAKLNMKSEIFDIEKDTEISSSEKTVLTIAVASEIGCASLCTSNEHCCSAVLEGATKMCQLYECCSPDKTEATGKVLFKKKLVTGNIIILRMTFNVLFPLIIFNYWLNAYIIL